jgi:diamine N-acetyltransferase
MNFTIREATVADAAMIADISRQTFYDTFAAQNSKENMEIFLEKQFTKKSLEEEVGKEENHFLLAMDGMDVAGYAKLRECDLHPSVNKPSIEIARIYVVKPWIGKGVGKLLMKTAIDYAQARNKKTLWLGVWEKNLHAIGFYKKYGFEKFGETEFYLGNDVQRDWLMQKEL